MNLLLLISLIIIGVSSQNNHGCKTDCDCPDFVGLVINNGIQVYERIDSCTFKLTCLDGEQPFVTFLWADSEIEKPSDSHEISTYFTTSFVVGSQPFPTVDFMSTYGVACEDGAWIATKYNLTLYYGTTGLYLEIPSETINGKKSKILAAGCDQDY
ncbi:unnamed protein product [Caenorhabditis brenneri]